MTGIQKDNFSSSGDSDCQSIKLTMDETKDISKDKQELKLQQFHIQESDVGFKESKLNHMRCCSKRCPLRVYLTVAFIILLFVVIISLSITLTFKLLNNTKDNVHGSKSGSEYGSADNSEPSDYDYNDYSDYYEYGTPEDPSLAGADKQTEPEDVGPSDEIFSSPGIIYRVDPRYFHDSDGDGHGDLIGVTQFMAYFKFMKVSSTYESENCYLFHTLKSYKYLPPSPLQTDFLNKLKTND